MRARLISFTALFLAACSTTQLPISPHKIDVQQGNVIDQEALDKLKPGLTRSQVRFLLGTPLLIDPFRDNRWDYVYNYRSAGKLTAQNRLTLYFDHDVLNRIETSGLEQTTAKSEPAPIIGKAEVPEAAPSAGPVAAPDSAGPTPAVTAEPPADNTLAAEAASQPQSTAAPPTQPAPPVTSKTPTAAATVKASAKAATRGVTSAGQSRVKTSVVPPLQASAPQPAPKPVESSPPGPVALRSDTNAANVKPDTAPDFPQPANVSTAEAPVLAAVKTWAKAWSDRDEGDYFAAYSSTFKPTGGVDRAEWERRRRLLFNMSKHIEVRVESPVVEFPAEGRALVTFNQSYRSATYRDNVVKQLTLALQDGRWLILDERVLPGARAKKKK